MTTELQLSLDNLFDKDHIDDFDDKDNDEQMMLIKMLTMVMKTNEDHVDDKNIDNNADNIEVDNNVDDNVDV